MEIHHLRSEPVTSAQKPCLVNSLANVDVGVCLPFISVPLATNIVCGIGSLYSTVMKYLALGNFLCSPQF